jgi:hypothetical protein
LKGKGLNTLAPKRRGTKLAVSEPIIFFAGRIYEPIVRPGQMPDFIKPNFFRKILDGFFEKIP